MKKIKPITAYTITNSAGELDWRWIAPYDYVAIRNFMGEATSSEWDKYKDKGHRLVKITISPFEKKKKIKNEVLDKNEIPNRKSTLQEIE